MAFQTAVDDFDGQGATCSPCPTSPRTRPWPCWASPGGTRRSPSPASAPSPASSPARPYCPDAGCSRGAARMPPQLAPGLFWYDEPSGHGLDRRQLAMTALKSWTAGSGGELALQFYDVGFDASTCAQQPPCPLAVTSLLGAPGGHSLPWAAGRSALGRPAVVPPTVSLAAGSFQGLVLNPTRPEPGAVGRGRRALRADRQRQPGQRGGQLLPPVRRRRRPVHGRHSCSSPTRSRPRTAPRAAGLRPGGGLPRPGGPAGLHHDREPRPLLHPAGPPQAPGLVLRPPAEARQLAQRRPQRQPQPDRHGHHHVRLLVADGHDDQLDDRGLGHRERHRRG